MILSIVLAAYLALPPPQQTAAERPAPPTDTEMLTALRDKAPAAEVLNAAHGARSRTDRPVICGTARVGDQIEPFAVVATWDDARIRITSRMNGVEYSSPTTPYWDIRAMVPPHTDFAGNGATDWIERNADASSRSVALMNCPDLTPPQGVTWDTEGEPNPDPVRAARAERLARQSVDLIFGARD